MTTRLHFVLAASFVTFLAGCATTHEKYSWGGYDHSLYVYYKDPATESALAHSLEATINTAQNNHAVVAPGIYAEYGYLMLQEGNAPAAVSAFRQEEARWPESKLFMDHMIAVAQVPTANASTASK